MYIWEHFDSVEIIFSHVAIIRVATAQGKQGFWLLTFPVRENTEFSKFNFLHRENCANTGKILNFLKILLLKWLQGDGSFLS